MGIDYDINKRMQVKLNDAAILDSEVMLALAIDLDENRQIMLSEQAESVARMLELGEIEPAPVIGSFACANVHFPGKGDEVVLAKGAAVYSTDPSWPDEGKQLKRSQRIKVHRLSHGFVDTSCNRSKQAKVEDPMVHWAGSGGYWRWTSVANALV